MKTTELINQPYLDPLARLDLEYIESLFEQARYFEIYAPPFSGKTTTLLALREHINAGNRYRAVYLDVAPAAQAGDDMAQASQMLLSAFVAAVQTTLDIRIGIKHDSWDSLSSAMMDLSVRCTLPVVMLFDNVDTLKDMVLLSLLRGIRSRYADRPKLFAQTVILSGIRRCGRYTMQLSETEVIYGSIFNILSETLVLPNWDTAQFQSLMDQYAKNGTPLDAKAQSTLWAYTAGQPRLIHVLAGYAIAAHIDLHAQRHHTNQLSDAQTSPVTQSDIRAALECLLDSQDPQVQTMRDWLAVAEHRPFAAKMLLGQFVVLPDAELDTLVDAGIFARDNGFRFTNGLYEEMVRRAVADPTMNAHSS